VISVVVGVVDPLLLVEQLWMMLVVVVVLLSMDIDENYRDFVVVVDYIKQQLKNDLVLL
jgi:hypothetical protein